MNLPYESFLAGIQWADTKPLKAIDDVNDPPPKRIPQIPLRRGGPRQSPSSACMHSEDAPQETQREEPEQPSPRAHFPTRLWMPRTDYAKNHNEQEQKMLAQQRSSPRSPARHQGHALQVTPWKGRFAVSVCRALWSDPEPSGVDLSYVPPPTLEEQDALVERLTKPPKKPTESTLHVPPVPQDDIDAIVSRLARPIPPQTTPYYRIIEPPKLDDEEIDNLIHRLTRRRTNDEISHPALPFLSPSQNARRAEEEKTVPRLSDEARRKRGPNSAATP